MCKAKLLVCLLAISISGCATNGRATDTACSWVRPIMISREDVLTEGTKRQIVSHNETWELVCEDPK
jgi:hypothetical protein